MKTANLLGLHGVTLLLTITNVPELFASFSCQEEDLTFATEKALKKCGDVFMEEIQPGRVPCLAKCIFDDAGMIDSNGKPDKEKIVTGIYDTVPIQLRDAYRTAAEKCFDELALGATKSTDESCSSYEPLPTCLLKAYASVCGKH